ncbi:hypothetical protein SCLCIDRAFT_12665 [Scleroderma citrinum Foug A]|uniref:Peptidyl-prolyl cis-trans isomerase n=1 Tax=Scleroderma citrinum Foug A TaxID=1036808 RepID=A0A0C3AYI5_9AGAM|nr:hypothetical protein SCLCIDRAFT_12665 [Scleroderma citrinum Foug A]
MSSWEVRMSNSKGVPYFFNSETKQSVWDPPEDLTEEQIDALPGARYLKSKEKSSPIRASHLLVKHKDSRRPASWKEANITRTKEEAIAILEQYENQIHSAKNQEQEFRNLAHMHSDCSSHSSDGDLGLFRQGQMQKPFEDAAFSLKVGEISGVVSTDSGVHLIMRTG